MGKIKITLNLRAKIIAVSSVILLVALGTNNLINSYTFHKEYAEALKTKVAVVGKSFNLQLDRLLAFGIPLDQLIGFDEQCQEIIKKYTEISAAFVTDTNGKILYHSDRRYVQTTVPPEEVSFITSGKEHITLQGRNYDVILPILDSNERQIGSTIIQFPESLISQKTAQLVISNTVVTVISFVLAAFILLFILTQWFTKPLTELLSVIKEIRIGGNLNKTVTIRSGDEIGQLGREFNEMAQKLKISYDNLEVKVAERTKELDQKIQELEQMNNLMVGRELKMTEMKRELAQLKGETPAAA